MTKLENLFNTLEEAPAVKELLIRDEFLFQFRKVFSFQLSDTYLEHIHENVLKDIINTAIPKIILGKYLITSIETERDTLKARYIITFIVLDICEAIRQGQKLSRNALEKARKYVMETEDAELLFKYKLALELCNV